MNQLELPEREASLDALDLVCGTDRCGTTRIKDLFIGALHLGPRSLQYTCGWWGRRRLPLPLVLGKIPEGTSLPPEHFAQMAAEHFDRFAWRWCHVAQLPSPCVVEWCHVSRTTVDQRGRKRTRMRRLSPVAQLEAFASIQFRADLRAIRERLEVFTGTRTFHTEADILDGLDGTPLEWSRALSALAGHASRMWWWRALEKYQPRKTDADALRK